MFTPKAILGTITAFIAALALAPAGGAQSTTEHFGFGKPASEQEIKEWAIAIPPSGKHLPPGGGTAAGGQAVYEAQCSACHGKDLQGVSGTGGAALIGGRGTLASGSPKKTVESYWPYATTVFDYVRRAMPFTSPGALKDDDVYAVTAYILYRGNIISRNKTMNADTLPKVEMPNKGGFVPDPRPDVHNYR